MFWFSLGMAAGVVAVYKASSAAQRVAPADTENPGNVLRELALAVGSFGADVRAGMAEREAELRATVSRRTGIDIAAHRLGVRTEPGRTPPGQDSARAGQAGSVGTRV